MDYLIRKGNIDDLDLINLFLEKENDYMSLMNLPKIDIPDLEKEIENGNIYVFKKGKILLGVSCVSLSLKDSYFSFTKSSKKEYDLLYSLNWNGENTVIIKYFAIEVDYQNKGFGKIFLDSLKSRFKDSFFFTVFNRFNTPYTSFLEKNRFLGPVETLGFEIPDKCSFLYFLSHKKEGLCSDPAF